MEKIKRKIKNRIYTMSIKRAMVCVIMTMICIVGILSAGTIYGANKLQQKTLNSRGIIVYDYKPIKSENDYIIRFNTDGMKWQDFSTKQSIIYYGSMVAMIMLPLIYIIVGIIVTTYLFYNIKLRYPVELLQNGIREISENNLDFSIEYECNDEMGMLCHAMEKMRCDLKNNYQKLWQVMEERNIINASVAHDLRTPITVIKGYLEYLSISIQKNNLSKDELEDTINYMNQASLRLENYVKSVSDVQKLDAIELKIHNEDYHEVLEEIKSNIKVYCNSLDNSIQYNNIELCNNCNLESLHIDKDILFRVIENLMSNAVRFAEQKIKITLSNEKNIETDKDIFIFKIEDDGKGFEDNELDVVFNPFYTTGDKEKHFGIGLYVCKILCEKHGGDIIIDNSEHGAIILAKFSNI